MVGSHLERLVGKTGPHRILALDGGGIRGIISLEILQRIEHLLRQDLDAGDEFVLADYFDFFAGTSTGAIIATALAMGMAVRDIIAFYVDCGDKMFQHAALWERFRYKYREKALVEELQGVFGADTTLGSEKLRALLMLVMRNANKDQAWTLTNNPYSPFNHPEHPGNHLQLPVWQLVRASTAAPVYFPPEVVRIGEHEFVFVDGSVSAYTNPTFKAFLKATAPIYEVNWPTGEEELLLVSIGTGMAPHRRQELRSEDVNLKFDLEVLGPSLIMSTVVEQDILCRMFGNCRFGPHLNKELGSLMGAGAPGDRKLFSYVRYNEDLTAEGLARLGLPDIDPIRVQHLDATEEIPSLRHIGQAIAQQQVAIEHLRLGASAHP